MSDAADPTAYIAAVLTVYSMLYYLKMAWPHLAGSRK